LIINTALSFSANFSDAGIHDMHTAMIDRGDETPVPPAHRKLAAPVLEGQP
jgi:hypothetical protein